MGLLGVPATVSAEGARCARGCAVLRLFSALPGNSRLGARGGGGAGEKESQAGNGRGVWGGHGTAEPPPRRRTGDAHTQPGQPPPPLTPLKPIPPPPPPLLPVQMEQREVRDKLPHNSRAGLGGGHLFSPFITRGAFLSTPPPPEREGAGEREGVAGGRRPLHPGLSREEAWGEAAWLGRGAGGSDPPKLPLSFAHGGSPPLRAPRGPGGRWERAGGSGGELMRERLSARGGGRGGRVCKWKHWYISI